MSQASVELQVLVVVTLELHVRPFLSTLGAQSGLEWQDTPLGERYMAEIPHLLIRAARGERIERAPVWAMRQAGRWDPEFNKLRSGHTFYEFSAAVDLAAQASLLPRRFDVDAIILFYDITSLPVAMGQSFTLQPA